MGGDGVDVDELRVLRYIAEIGQGRTVLLDQVVPCVPLPDDAPTFRAYRLNFDDKVRPDRVVSQALRIEACR